MKSVLSLGQLAGEIQHIIVKVHSFRLSFRYNRFVPIRKIRLLRDHTEVMRDVSLLVSFVVKVFCILPLMSVHFL